jgi:predicted PurR-regulated permease PerM
MKHFSKLCMPAKIYFSIAVVATIIALFSGVPIMMGLMKLVFAFIWTYVLGWLCKRGYSSISWVLVLLPYIIIALAMFNIYSVTHYQKQIMRTIGLQGAYGQEAMSNQRNQNKQSSQSTQQTNLTNQQKAMLMSQKQ